MSKAIAVSKTLYHVVGDTLLRNYVELCIVANDAGEAERQARGWMSPRLSVDRIEVVEHIV